MQRPVVVGAAGDDHVEPELARAPVDGVAGDREVDRRKVDSNLVRPPRLQPHVEERGGQSVWVCVGKVWGWRAPEH